MSLDTLTRARREELLRSLCRKKEQNELMRLRWFKPNPGFQEAFLRSRAKIRACFVGNQGGKTTIGAYETAALALGIHPHKKVRTPNVGVVVSAQGFKEGIEKTIMPKFRQIVGTRDIARIKNNSMGIPNQITWSNGSVTHMMSVEQDDMVFEGTTLDYAWLDEPMRRNIFIALKRGMLTTGGLLWMTCTPLSEPWIYEEIYVPGKEGVDPEIHVFEGSIYENPNITEKEVNELKRRLTADEVQTRIFGRFHHLAGRVVKEYNPEKHQIKRFDIPRHWPVWAAIDPHRNKPHAVVFLAVAPDGKKYVCNEIFYNCTIKELGEIFLKVAQQYMLVDILIDTSAQEDGWTKVSARQMLQDMGIYTKLAQKKNKRESGILLLNQHFRDDGLFVMEHCKRTHRELLNWVYKKVKRDNREISDEPEKKMDDCMDALRYILVENPTYSGPASIKQSGPMYLFR